MNLPHQADTTIERPLPAGGVLRIQIVEQLSPSAKAAGRALWERLLAEPDPAAPRPATDAA